jgi:hypothetical protein
VVPDTLFVDKCIVFLAMRLNDDTFGDSRLYFVDNDDY